MAVTLLIILVLLIAVGAIAGVVFRATRKGANPGGEHSDDTPEHAGRQTPEGTTNGGQDAGERGGTGTPVHSGYAGTSDPREREDDPDAAAHVARPGEGEGAARTSFEGRQPRR
jgi:hypothetical protein